jgi:hypothetical protein
MTEPNPEVRWSVIGMHAPVVVAECARCHLRVQFEGKLAFSPVLRHCRRTDEPPAEITIRVAACRSM